MPPTNRQKIEIKEVVDEIDSLLSLIRSQLNVLEAAQDSIAGGSVLVASVSRKFTEINSIFTECASLKQVFVINHETDADYVNLRTALNSIIPKINEYLIFNNSEITDAVGLIRRAIAPGRVTLNLSDACRYLKAELLVHERISPITEAVVKIIFDEYRKQVARRDRDSLRSFAYDIAYRDIRDTRTVSTVPGAPSRRTFSEVEAKREIGLMIERLGRVSYANAENNLGAVVARYADRAPGVDRAVLLAHAESVLSTVPGAPSRRTFSEVEAKREIGLMIERLGRVSYANAENNLGAVVARYADRAPGVDRAVLLAHAESVLSTVPGAPSRRTFSEVEAKREIGLMIERLGRVSYANAENNLGAVVARYADRAPGVDRAVLLAHAESVLSTVPGAPSRRTFSEVEAKREIGLMIERLGRVSYANAENNLGAVVARYADRAPGVDRAVLLAHAESVLSTVPGAPSRRTFSEVEAKREIGLMIERLGRVSYANAENNLGAVVARYADRAPGVDRAVLLAHAESVLSTVPGAPSRRTFSEVEAKREIGLMIERLGRVSYANAENNLGAVVARYADRAPGVDRAVLLAHAESVLSTVPGAPAPPSTIPHAPPVTGASGSLEEVRKRELNIRDIMLKFPATGDLHKDFGISFVNQCEIYFLSILEDLRNITSFLAPLTSREKYGKTKAKDVASQIKKLTKFIKWLDELYNKELRKMSKILAKGNKATSWNFIVKYKSLLIFHKKIIENINALNKILFNLGFAIETPDPFLPFGSYTRTASIPPVPIIGPKITGWPKKASDPFFTAVQKNINIDESGIPD